MIRAARFDDIPAVNAIVQTAFAPFVPRIGRNPAPMEQDYAALASQGRLWVAEDAGDVAGLLVCFPKDDVFFVETVAIAPGHQGQGIGRLLMGHAEMLAAKHHKPAVALYTNAAMTENITFYDRLGYSITERRVEDGFERIFFEKAALSPRS